MDRGRRAEINVRGVFLCVRAEKERERETETGTED